MTQTKIKINPFFWPIILGSIITGQFLEIITLFAIVIIHELGHVFAAKSYEWRIIEIHLLPFGGMASVDPKSATSLWEEFIVAIAGPLQNFLMVILGIGLNKLGVWSNEWTTFFIQANLWIGLFNLLPIFPLDGEKLLKAFLYLLFSYRTANHISLFISMVVALIFLSISSGVIGTMKIHINGTILGIFFLYMNWMELKQLPYRFMKFLVTKAEEKKELNKKAAKVFIKEEQTVIQALRLMKRDQKHMFYLLSNEGEIVAVLPEDRLLHSLFDDYTLYQPIHKLVI